MPLNGRSAGMGSGAFRARLLDSRSVSARRRARLVVIEAGSLVLVYSVLPRFEGMLLSTEYSASAIAESLHRSSGAARPDTILRCVVPNAQA
jgi:hypothetical protein